MLFWTILGIVLAAAAGTGLSIFVLIGSQGMNDRTPILPTIAAYVPMLAIAHGLGAAFGLIPVASAKGYRAWMFAVCGFAAGGALEGLLFPIWLVMKTDSESVRQVVILAYLGSLLLPAMGGILGLVLLSRTANPRGDGT